MKKSKEETVITTDGQEIPRSRAITRLHPITLKDGRDALASRDGSDVYLRDAKGTLRNLGQKLPSKKQRHKAYNDLLAVARLQGWAVPTDNSFPRALWVQYWVGKVRGEDVVSPRP